MQILADLLNTIPAITLPLCRVHNGMLTGLLKPVGSLGKLRRLPYNWQECRG